MRSVDQFRAEYSRTGHVGKEPDASYRFPVASHGPMNVAYNRTRDFAVAIAQDLEQIDRNHAVCSLNFSLLFPPIGRSFFRWVRASAPTGCSPRDSGRLLAISSDLFMPLMLVNSLSCLPQIRELCFQQMCLCTCWV